MTLESTLYPTEEAYHADFSRISRSMLSVFIDSKDDYRRIFVDKSQPPKKPTTEMVVGKAVHAMCLEGKTVDEVVVRYPLDCYKKNGHLNPTPARAYEAQVPDRMVVRDRDYEAIMDISANVLNSPLNGLLTDPAAIFEQTYIWNDKATGLPCRCRVDFALDVGTHVMAYDLKNTALFYPAAFKRVARRLRYWLQDAHYSEALEDHFGKPVKFKFWLIETTSPFRLRCVEYDTPSRDMARTWRSRIMKELAGCLHTRKWDDAWLKETTTLSVAPWDEEIGDEELEGFDDDEAEA